MLAAVVAASAAADLAVPVAPPVPVLADLVPVPEDRVVPAQVPVVSVALVGPLVLVGRVRLEALPLPVDRQGQVVQVEQRVLAEQVVQAADSAAVPALPRRLHSRQLFSAATA